MKKKMLEKIPTMRLHLYFLLDVHIKIKLGLFKVK